MNPMVRAQDHTELGRESLFVFRLRRQFAQHRKEPAAKDADSNQLQARRRAQIAGAPDEEARSAAALYNPPDPR